MLALPEVTVTRGALLSQYTRFGIGGPADVYIETANQKSFIDLLREVRRGTTPWVVIGSGSNLVVSDQGFRGIVLRYTAPRIDVNGSFVRADSGAILQNLVDRSIEHGLARIHTMTGIPGTVGAAVYGNAGAYGHSIMESVREVRYFDGEQVRVADNAACEFRYRESIFKRRKDWIILSIELELVPGDRDDLKRLADEILATRNAKYPPTMRCAGSIFKNLILSELPETVRQTLPPRVIREGKVPSAFFLEEVGAKGMVRGGIRVADYHANLIYNEGGGTAVELRAVIDDLKRRVRERFAFELEEEVQYVGFQ